MALKIFHTGDIHIGMRFNNYGEVKEKLIEARFNSLESMINKSNELNADMFVVAGDLFNSIKVAKKDVKRTVNILNKFNGNCVLVLPGNHDYDDGVVELWKDFQDMPSEKIMVLNDIAAHSMEDYDLDLTIYSAPCNSKHSKENSLTWFKETGLQEGSKYHIGIAHGALEGLSPDIEGNYYYMAMEELHSIPTDLWLLGHTHVRYPLVEKISNHKIYNAGTPEPDGLDYKDEGSAWFIKLEDEKVEAERIRTGQFRFYDKNFLIDRDEDLEEIRAWALEGDPSRKLVRLNLKGNLSKEAYEGLNQFYQDLEHHLLHLIIEDSNLRVRINKDIIDQEFTHGSFPYEFLHGLTEDEEALQIAYDLVRRK